MTPSSRKRVVDRACFRPPKKKVGHVQTIRFTIYDFKKAQALKKKRIKSPVLKAHGVEWKIWCYPNGNRSVAGSHVSIFLRGRTKNVAGASYRLRIQDWSVIKNKLKTHSTNLGTFCYIGRCDFLPLAEVDEFLEADGSLVIEADIEMIIASKDVWYPKSLERQDFLVNLYHNAAPSETSDAIFSVGGNEYHAHKSILAVRCKCLYEIAKECDSDEPIFITSTSPEIFKGVLDFAYTVKYPEIENKTTAMELLIAADCYDCIHLKLYVESIMVERFMTSETAAELLLFADSYSCALLKEAATNAFLTDAAIVKSSEAWSKVQESSRLLTELLDAHALTCSSKSKCGDDIDDIEWMDVGTLRNELEKVDLLLDGSREVLVERLRTFRAEQKDSEGESEE